MFFELASGKGWTDLPQSYTGAAGGDIGCMVGRVTRSCALAVLLSVTLSAVWCVDGCIDPLAQAGRGVATHDADQGDGRLPCLCVIPFQTEPLGPPHVVWVAKVLNGTPALPTPPPAPSFDIDHPPRTL